jgi:hypothetical protein
MSVSGPWLDSSGNVFPLLSDTSRQLTVDASDHDILEFLGAGLGDVEYPVAVDAFTDSCSNSDDDEGDEDVQDLQAPSDDDVDSGSPRGDDVTIAGRDGTGVHNGNAIGHSRPQSRVVNSGRSSAGVTTRPFVPTGRIRLGQSVIASMPLRVRKRALRLLKRMERERVKRAKETDRRNSGGSGGGIAAAAGSVEQALVTSAGVVRGRRDINLIIL